MSEAVAKLSSDDLEEMTGAASQWQQEFSAPLAFKAHGGDETKSVALDAAFLRRVLSCGDDLAADMLRAVAEVERLRMALEKIQKWDMLNPPNPNFCADFPWLRELVDAALGDQK